MVTVTFEYDPDAEESDSEDKTGLTTEAFDELMDKLLALGADNIDIQAVRT